MSQRTSPPNNTPSFRLALLLALLTAFEPLAAMLALRPALAQTPAPSFSPPNVVPNGTTVRVDGASSMATINAALKKAYEEKYAGTNVTLAEDGSDAALKALVEGKADLAAIGRLLTAQEKQKGLVTTPIARHKIAIIVSPNNPFTGNITFEQFAKIFRGEIKDWSELGGTPGAIRFVDRPDFSDTRQAFRPYPVFQKASFKTGETAKQTAKDSTDEVVQALGTDGIGYAIADQVLDRKDVRMISMHKTLPANPRYPFSQPLVYVYKGTPGAAVASFINVATAPESQPIVEAARKTGATAGASPIPVSSLASASASPEASPSPAATGTTAPDVAAVSPGAEARGAFPWWLLLIPLVGVLLWFWFKGRRTESAPVEPPTAVAPPDLAPTPPIATPSIVPDGLDPVSETPVTGLSAGDAAIAGGTVLAAGAGAAGLAGNADTSENGAIDSPTAIEPPIETAPSVESPSISSPSVETAAPAANLSENDGIPGAAVLGDVLTTVAGAAALTGLAGKGDTARSTITLTPLHQTVSDETTPHRPQAYAEWDASDEHKAALRQQGGRSLVLRLYDVTGIDLSQTRPQGFQEFPVTEAASTYIAAVLPDRDYMAEIGYITGDRYWLSLALSHSIRIPSVATGAAEAAAALGGAAIGAGLTAALDNQAQANVEAVKYNVGQSDLNSEALASVDEGLPALPDGYGDSRIVLMPRDPQWGYAYWDAPNEQKEALRQQGGQRFALRLYDVTDVDISHQSAHSLQQYDCEELGRDWYVPIPVSDRDYIAEIGYLTGDGRWLLLARSNPVRIPPVYPSAWLEDHFISVAWEDDLRGGTLLELLSPAQRTATLNSPLHEQSFGMAQPTEALRVAGSLFSSMPHITGSGQQMPSQAVSAYVFPSGVGLGAAPGFPGVPTFSGLTMSGVGMSGIGFGAAMPPLQARKFWLVADAEIIVYGATEPDAIVTIDGRPIQLNPDGTFRFHLSFQDGVLNFPIVAVAADGEQTRSIHMTFDRETPYRKTNTKGEAVEELF